MKGIIFNLLEEVVDREIGEGAWDGLLEAARVEGVYTSLGNYPDAEMVSLVGAAAERFGKTPAEVLRWFGAAALHLLAERYPVFFHGHKSSETFLPTLNDVIHKEVRKIYAGADVPDFRFEPPAPGRLVMSYASARGLCAFAEGLITGTARHFGEDVALTQTQCTHRGDPRCVFDLSFSRCAT